MKTFEEIINQQPIFLHDWSNMEEVFGSFESWETQDHALSNHKEEAVLFASYGNDNYSGAAWVLFLKDGKLYEVNGSHCSCYGLEDQWSPEEVMLEELEHRLVNGEFGEDDYSDNNFKKEVCEFLGVEFKKNKEEYY
ncbi:hypothetical protein [Paenibacillus donghaensis]|uniref:Uncharacterized protein n=1 Tax=Paenibacillus donghaensis TaxID=414771 RepID=A0A2Z2KF76_9BACL|nr:hypothetical protein [Paenibacillus donghaensis]ASA22615.1 hypothetical protein B9T62_18585 [Paenibacillus donghaensis]